MSELEVFRYAGHEVRTIVRDDDIRFVAVDVASALGVTRTHDVIRGLDEDEKGTEIIRTLGGDQDVTVISEAGLYSVLLRSRSPSAKPLRRWVTHEVLPAIRREGGYIRPDASHEQLVQLADRAAAQARVLQALHGIVDPKWLEAKARHVAAQALGEQPEVEWDSRPLTVGEYLEGRGITASIARRVGPNFGKRVKALYIAEHGTEPPMAERFIDGAPRLICSYTESDRQMFDRAWDQVRI